MTQAMYALLSQLDSITKDPRILGFEPTFQRLERVVNQPRNDTFPPHNIVRTEDEECESFEIQIALAGYAEDDIKITLHEQVLTVATDQLEKVETDYVHQGIAKRKFTKQFTLGEYLEVRKAEFTNGLLSIHIDKVIPEEKKPKTIEINPLKKKGRKKSLLTE